MYGNPAWLCCVSRCVVCWWMESIPAVASTSSSTRPATAVRPALSASRARSRRWWDRRILASFQANFQPLRLFRSRVGDGRTSTLFIPTYLSISHNTQTGSCLPVCICLWPQREAVSYIKRPAAVTQFLNQSVNSQSKQGNGKCSRFIWPPGVPLPPERQLQWRVN